MRLVEDYTTCGMKLLFVLSLSIPLSIFCSTISKAQANLAAAKNYQFVNGQWFDGVKFRRQTFYSMNGVLTQNKPARIIDETIDLQNGYAVPPFSDAHCHHFDTAHNVKKQTEMYLRDGIFYAKSQTDIRSSTLKIADKVNIPTSVDVSYTHGALTHTFGHGIETYEALELGLFSAKALEENKAKIAANRTLENDAYYIIDMAEDLENKWRKIIDGKPDFLKIYLLHSEEFQERLKNIPNMKLGTIGLDPRLVPIITKKAHAAGFRVSAHVETAADYRIALDGGVDEMAHLPGYYFDLDENEKYQLTEKDVRETSRRKVWVIPTPNLPQDIKDVAILKRVETVARQNLTLLKNKKVSIAFGADAYMQTPLEYVVYIASLGIFSNLEMFKIWCEDTPRTIFHRKIGKLKSGFTKLSF